MTVRQRTLAVAFLLLAGCGDPHSPWQDLVPPDGQVLGEIAGYNSDDPRIEVRQTRRIVEVDVTSYGGGCHSIGETKVLVSGSVADVMPFDRVAVPPGGACTLPLLSFRHRATVEFTRPGHATIRVWGIDRSRRAGIAGDTLVVTRVVTIP